MENERIELLNDLELSLGCRFEDILLLDTALTHSSYTHEYRELDPKDNETLEFLGDAVLGLCISDIIIKQFPEYSEGQLSALRASLVNEQTLATVAEDFKLGKYILLGRGEEISGGRTKKSILSDTFEAVTGAMFLDQGYAFILSFISRIFEPLITERTGEPTYKDFKSRLQELCHRIFKTLPAYNHTGKYGPDHDKIFEVTVSVRNKMLATGIGKSKKGAEQDAARKAIEQLTDIES